MALEALSSNELLNFIIYDTLSASAAPYSSQLDYHSSETGTFLLENDLKPQEQQGGDAALTMENHTTLTNRKRQSYAAASSEFGNQLMMKKNLGVQGRKKRKRKPRVCKNREEAETQRMTHIAVERNRRKQMNEHLAVLRSLMPESYVQRGDQASIVGGAIEFVKELEHLLQSLEAQKLQLIQQGIGGHEENSNSSTTTANAKFLTPPFAQFFLYPQYTWSQNSKKYTSKTKAAIADIEVTLIETHASLRILSRRSPKQLSKLVAGFQALNLSILHLNVITMNALVLYSVSVKLEEGCLLTSVDDIAAAVHHMLRIIEEEAALY